MFWNVKFSKKGFVYFVLSITSMATMFMIIFNIYHTWIDMEFEDIRQDYYQSLKRLFDDFGQIPYSDIYVARGSVCNAGDENVFVRQWKGTRAYCLADVGKMEGWPKDKFSNCPGSLVDAKPSINMTEFEGVTICGKKEAQSFINA